MQEIESMSMADRVASLVLAAALIIAVSLILLVGPNTALSAASVATSDVTHHVQPANGVTPDPQSNYFPSPVTTPDAKAAEPIATF